MTGAPDSHSRPSPPARGRVTTPGDRRPGRRGIVLLATSLAAWGLAVVGLAAMIASSQEGAREELRERFELRAELAGAFVASYVGQLAGDEQRIVASELAGRGRDDFERVVRHFGFRAAVLVDRRGRLVQVEPRDARLVGAPIGARYAHLSAALGGRVAVSNVVPSAARREPIVAVAVPYRGGVFSGAFAPGETPIGTYLRHALPIAGSELELVDRNGLRIASNRPGAIGRPVPARGGDGWVVVEQVVPGTPWRVRAATRERALLSPLGGLRGALPWLVLAAFALVGLVANVLLHRLATSRRRLARANRELGELAHLDPLTGLPNRRQLDAALERELARAARTGRPVAVLMGDVDGFKQINDTAGHHTGDRVLQAMAERWVAALRACDLCSRWGGDELVALLPDTGADGAAAAAERVRVLAAAPVVGADGVTRTTMSIGWAVWRGEGESAGSLLARADAALYAAKRGGRDQACGDAVAAS
jgi:diguanylate cyclase (GGDEF)-like protein